MFDKVEVEDSFQDHYWKNITPKKKRKLENDHLTNQIDLDPPSLNRKKSVLDQLQFLAPLTKRSSFLQPKPHHNRRPSVSQWAPELNHFKMEPEPESDHELQEQFQDELPSMRLNKKMTMIDQNIMSTGLKLYKNNSTIEIEQKANETEEIKYGDNVFIQQIYTLQRGLSRKESMVDNKKSNKFRSSQWNDDETERLLRDYQITSSINAYVKHHQNYLCLNKLERIFYYVKKITFSGQFPESEVHDLCSQQVRTHHKDEDGHLLRFYQSWTEQDCIYLIFETASFSLFEKNNLNVRLRENQVWRVLTDCCSALQWMRDQLNQYHLNIKPGNILKCRDKYKLSDPLINSSHLLKILGMLSKEENSSQDMRLLMPYCAPEIIQYRKLLRGLDLHKSDIYSLGMSVLQNITRIPVSILMKNLKEIRKNAQRFMKSYSPALQNLLMKMINSDPDRRPNASQIAFLQNMDDNNFQKQKKRRLSL